jgi:hypothetical protein
MRSTAGPEGPPDRRPARLRPHGRRFAPLLNLRNKVPLLATAGRKAAGLLGPAQPARMAVRPLLPGSTARPRARRRWPPNGPWCCSSTPSTASSSPPMRRPPCRCCRPPATPCTWPPRRRPTASTCAAAAPTWPAAGRRSEGQGARGGRGARPLRRERHRHRRPRALVPAHAARRAPVDGPGQSRPNRSPPMRCCWKNSWRANSRPAGSMG